MSESSDERLDRISRAASVEPGASPWRSPALAATLVVLLVAALVSTGVVAHRLRHPADGEAPDGQLTAATARADALRAAGSLAARATAYRWDHFDADIDRAESGMTAGFRTQYAATMRGTRAQAVRGRATVTSRVAATALRSIAKGRATVLVFVDQVTTARGSANQRLERTRLLIGLVRQDGHWRIGQIDTV